MSCELIPLGEEITITIVEVWTFSYCSSITQVEVVALSSFEEKEEQFREQVYLTVSFT